MKLTLVDPATGHQKEVVIEDDKKLTRKEMGISLAELDKRIAQEIKGSRGEEFGYVYKMMGGCEKQEFSMKQGGLTADDVRILFDLSKEDDIRKYVKAPKIKRRQLRH